MYGGVEKKCGKSFDTEITAAMQQYKAKRSNNPSNGLEVYINGGIYVER